MTQGLLQRRRPPAGSPPRRKLVAWGGRGDSIQLNSMEDWEREAADALEFYRRLRIRESQQRMMEAMKPMIDSYRRLGQAASVAALHIGNALRDAFKDGFADRPDLA